jgi:hypothetical protein
LRDEICEVLSGKTEHNFFEAGNRGDRLHGQLLKSIRKKGTRVSLDHPVTSANSFMTFEGDWRIEQDIVENTFPIPKL